MLIASVKFPAEKAMLPLAFFLSPSSVSSVTQREGQEETEEGLRKKAKGNAAFSAGNLIQLDIVLYPVFGWGFEKGNGKGSQPVVLVGTSVGFRHHVETSVNDEGEGQHCTLSPISRFHVFGIGQHSVGFTIRIEVKTTSKILVCSFCASLCYICHLSLTYVLSFKLLQSAFIIFPSHYTIFGEGFFPIFCLSIQFLDINNSSSYLNISGVNALSPNAETQDVIVGPGNRTVTSNDNFLRANLIRDYVGYTNIPSFEDYYLVIPRQVIRPVTKLRGICLESVFVS
ncbi:hypothetical protein HYC85_007347 [Camellia sinensis]|uniref:Generative cell specific-1/HAP2 domain-containing protein n=1 Tax=Camellia sinensis TaxID=4442 RepID=A0A7J7HQK6_CAMSI|nr:hypothetical protein HYC85_007347 [Camellia sinensis]